MLSTNRILDIVDTLAGVTVLVPPMMDSAAIANAPERVQIKANAGGTWLVELFSDHIVVRHRAPTGHHRESLNHGPRVEAGLWELLRLVRAGQRGLEPPEHAFARVRLGPPDPQFQPTHQSFGLQVALVPRDGGTVQLDFADGSRTRTDARFVSASPLTVTANAS